MKLIKKGYFKQFLKIKIKDKQLNRIGSEYLITAWSPKDL